MKQKQQILATIHERLEHLRFAKLKLLSIEGLITRDLSNIDPPTCPGYTYGKSHHRPWRHKTRKIPRQYKIKPSTKCGEVIIIDQLVS